MDGGKWHSGVYETERDAQKARVPSARSPRASAVETGTATPTMYNPTPTEARKDSRMTGIVTVALRSLLIVFTLMAFALMAASNESNYVGTSSSTKFTDVHSFVGLLSVAIIVCVYSIVQLVLSVVQVISTSTFIPSPTSVWSLVTFIFDSVLAYALIAAAAAAADSEAVLKQYHYCDGLSKFCDTSSASIAIAFIAFAILASCAALFPIRLYKMRLSR